MRRFLKWIFAIVFWVTGGITACVLLLLFLFQIKSFRQLIYPPIINLVNTLLIAKIEVSDVHFTGFSSLEVDEAKLITEGDTLAQITRVYADLNIPDLLKNRLTIHSVFLQSPRIKLLRNSAGVWNLERIVKPTPPTEKEPGGDFIINAGDVVLDNAEIDFIDSLALAADGIVDGGSGVNYSKMQFRDLALRVSAKEFNVNTLTGEAAINGMHFREINSDAVLEDLTLKAKIEHSKITLSKFKLKMPKTDLKLTASVSDFCLTEAIDDAALKKAKIDLNIEKSLVCSDDIEKFVAIGLQSGIIAELSSECSGGINAIKINSFAFRSLESNLNVQGNLRGILDGNISYDATIKKSKITYRNLANFLPKDIATSIPNFGGVNLRSVSAVGTDHNVVSTLDVQSDYGNIIGDAGVIFAPDLSYNADLALTNVDVGKITGSVAMDSRINGHIKASGYGSDLSKMNARVDVDFRGSRYTDYLINMLVMQAKMENGKIILDKCHFELPARFGIASLETLMREDMQIDVSGYFNCQNMDNPDYDIKASLQNIDLADLMGNDGAPDNLSASLTLSGQGINPDSMQANAMINIEDLVFNNRSQFPFDIALDINTLSEKEKYVKIVSDIVNVDLEGDFKVASAGGLFGNLGAYIAKTITDKIEYVYTPSFVSQPYYAVLDAADFSCRAEVKDIGIVNSFLVGQEIYSQFEFGFDMKSTDRNAEFNLTNLHIGEFSYIADSIDVYLRNLNLNSLISINDDSTGLALQKCLLNLKSTENSAIAFNATQISSPGFAISVSEDSVKYSVAAIVNDVLEVANRGSLAFDNSVITLLSDSLKMTYADFVRVTNQNPLNIVVADGKIQVKEFKVEEANGILVALTGSVSATNFDNLNIDISGINLRKADTLLRVMQITELPDVDGNITLISINANGLLSDPVYSIDVKTDNIIMNNISAGILNLDLKYVNKNIYGTGGLKSATSDVTLFRFDVRSFPIDLSLATDSSAQSQAYESTVPVDFVASSDSLSLAILSPFITPVSDLHGLVKMNLQVKGNTIDSLQYSGNIDLPQFDFTLAANNMHYSGKSGVIFDNETIRLKETKVYNDPTDYKGGSATLQGRIDMKGFEIGNMNFIMSSDGILVLNRNSAKAIPMIYGNLLVSTGDMPITFNGSIDAMTLNGDINVVQGSLNMPPMTSSTSGTIQSNMLYKVEVHDQNGRRYFNVIDNATNDTLYSEVPDLSEQGFRRDSAKTEMSSGLTNIKMDLNIRILNPIMLKLDLGAMGQLVAKLSTENSSVPLNFYYDFLHDDIKLNGEIMLLDGSQLTYIKQFATKGKISFPSGTVYNPTFDLTATYSGKSTVNNKSREYEVYLYVKGPFSNPQISFGYNMDGNEATGDSTRITQDALFLIVLGRTKTEIESGTSGGSNNSNLGSLGMSSLSAAFSKTMTDLLGGAGSIESAEIDMSNSDSWQDARIKVSGKLFDNIQWKIGGDLNDITNNSEFSLDIPIDLALHPDYLNNIVWHISRSTNIQQTTMNKNQKEWEIMLKFGGSW